MLHSVVIEPAADRDLAEGIRHYNTERIGLGVEFLDEAFAAFRRIAENPRQYPRFERDAHKTRLDRFPYLVLYRFDENNVYILGVMSGYLKPRTLRRRTWRP